MAALIETVSGKGNIICNGTLIGEQWVLTASHCMFLDKAGKYPMVASMLIVVLGEHDKAVTSESTIPRISVNVSKILKHEDYKAVTHYNDVALIKLVESLNLNVYTPACIGQTGDNF